MPGEAAQAGEIGHAGVKVPEGKRFVELVDNAARDKQNENLEEASSTVPLTVAEEKWLQKHHGGV